MSRIGRLPVEIPAGVTVELEEGNTLTVKGAKGTLKRTLPAEMNIVSENKFIVLDELKFDEIKTKKMQAVLDALKVDNALIIVGEDSENVVLSARNLSTVATIAPTSINVYDILKYGTVIATKSSVAAIEEVYA